MFWEGFYVVHFHNNIIYIPILLYKNIFNIIFLNFGRGLNPYPPCVRAWLDINHDNNSILFYSFITERIITTYNTLLHNHFFRMIRIKNKTTLSVQHNTRLDIVIIIYRLNQIETVFLFWILLFIGCQFEYELYNGGLHKSPNRVQNRKRQRFFQVMVLRKL
jgi:hypothetical protein